MFTWLERTQPRKDGHEHRAKIAAAELASRAGLLYRLGFSQAEATRWLCARVAWEFDPPSKHGAHRRHDSLSDQAIGKIVTETYARRPG
jgi:hypothetical protein